jgi:YjzC-like protein
MAIPIGSRFRTGQVNPESGGFRFDGYLDGTWVPTPKPHEKEIPLSKGEIFPPIHSANKGCWWKLIRVL